MKSFSGIFTANFQQNSNTDLVFILLMLTHFSLMFQFYTPWKRQKTSEKVIGKLG